MATVLATLRARGRAVLTVDDHAAGAMMGT
jgi:hypothetical protein